MLKTQLKRDTPELQDVAYDLCYHRNNSTHLSDRLGAKQRKQLFSDLVALGRGFASQSRFTARVLQHSAFNSLLKFFTVLQTV